MEPFHKQDAGSNRLKCRWITQQHPLASVVVALIVGEAMNGQQLADAGTACGGKEIEMALLPPFCTPLGLNMLHHQLADSPPMFLHAALGTRGGTGNWRR
jgi:hypothetical protein